MLQAGAAEFPPVRGVRLLLANLATAAVYIAVSVPVALLFAWFPAPFWPGAGIALFAALALGPAAAPGILLGALAGYIAAYSLPVAAASVAAVVSTGAALGAAYLLRRKFAPKGPALALRDVIALGIWGVLLHSAVSAAGGATGAMLFGLNPEPWPDVFRRWFLADASGTLLAAPAAILLWLDRRPASYDRWREMGALAAAVLAISAVRFLVPQASELHAAVPFLIVLPCTWLAIRFPQREAFLLFALVMVVAVGGAILLPPTFQPGIFGLTAVPPLAIAAGSINVLMVSALGEEHRVALVLAGVDGLSGLANRRTFFDRANQELERASRYGRPLSLATFDLDRFKAVNDTHGHAAGDAAIRATATCVAGQLRNLDTLARIGGEEFAVLLPETNLVKAAAVCERLRAAIARTSVRAGPEPRAAKFSVTASFGVTAFLLEDDTVDAALQRADDAMYRAKEEGRDRVIVG